MMNELKEKITNKKAKKIRKTIYGDMSLKNRISKRKRKIEEVIEKYLYEFQAEVIQWKNDTNYNAGEFGNSQIEIPPIEEKRKFYIERLKVAIWRLIIGKESRNE